MILCRKNNLTQRVEFLQSTMYNLKNDGTSLIKKYF